MDCKSKHQKRTQSGFTLLETCVAMVVMMIGGLGVAAVLVYAIKNNTGARDRAAAIAVAQQEHERLRVLPFTDPQLAATGTTVTPRTVTSASRSYSIRTTIVNTTASLKTIQVQVTPLSGSDAWALSSVQVTSQRAAATLGPYIGGS